MVRGIPTFPSTEALTEELGVQQQSNPHLQTLFKLPVSAKIGRSYKPRFFRYLKTQISRDRVTASVHFTSGRPCRGQSRHGTTYLTHTESTNQLSLVYQSEAKWSVDPPLQFEFAPLLTDTPIISTHDSQQMQIKSWGNENPRSFPNFHPHFSGPPGAF